MTDIIQKPSQVLHCYHKVGMSVKGTLVGTHRTHFHSLIMEVRGQGTPVTMAMPVFPRQNLA